MYKYSSRDIIVRDRIKNSVVRLAYEPLSGIRLYELKEGRWTRKETITSCCFPAFSAIINKQGELYILFQDISGVLMGCTVSEKEVKQEPVLLWNQQQIYPSFMQAVVIEEAVHLFYIFTDEETERDVLVYQAVDKKGRWKQPQKVDYIDSCTDIPLRVLKNQLSEIAIVYQKYERYYQIGYRTYELQTDSWSEFSVFDSSSVPYKDFSPSFYGNSMECLAVADEIDEDILFHTISIGEERITKIWLDEKDIRYCLLIPSEKERQSICVTQKQRLRFFIESELQKTGDRIPLCNLEKSYLHKHLLLDMSTQCHLKEVFTMEFEDNKAIVFPLDEINEGFTLGDPNKAVEDTKQKIVSCMNQIEEQLNRLVSEKLQLQIEMNQKDEHSLQQGEVLAAKERENLKLKSELELISAGYRKTADENRALKVINTVIEQEKKHYGKWIEQLQSQVDFCMRRIHLFQTEMNELKRNQPSPKPAKITANESSKKGLSSFLKHLFEDEDIFEE